MNTVKSFWYGWGVLCLSGGGAYYFAKKSINADRAARYEADQKRRQVQESLEYSATHTQRPPTKKTSVADTSGSPSHEATLDPAPTRHATATEGQKVLEKSKYETSEPFRSKKGDRFS